MIKILQIGSATAAAPVTMTTNHQRCSGVGEDMSVFAQVVSRPLQRFRRRECPTLVWEILQTSFICTKVEAYLLQPTSSGKKEEKKNSSFFFSISPAESTLGTVLERSNGAKLSSCTHEEDSGFFFLQVEPKWLKFAFINEHHCEPGTRWRGPWREKACDKFKG